MADIEAKDVHQRPADHKKERKHSVTIVQILLRILTICCTLAAMCVMVTNKQTATVYGIDIDARYSYSSAFMFFAYANGIASLFCVISLFVTVFLARQGSTSCNFFVLFLHDLLMMSLVLAGCAAATAIGVLGQYGNSHTGWMEICDHFGRFCNRVVISLILSYSSFLFLLILTIASANVSRELNV